MFQLAEDMEHECFTGVVWVFNCLGAGWLDEDTCVKVIDTKFLEYIYPFYIPWPLS